MRRAPGGPKRSDGFTLVELLIVIGVMGVVALAIAFAFVAIVRTSPAAEARADDSRTVLGLNTYLPEDVNSTPAAGFDFTKNAATGCSSGGSPGVSLVRMTWTE